MISKGLARGAVVPRALLWWGFYGGFCPPRALQSGVFAGGSCPPHPPLGGTGTGSPNASLTKVEKRV